MDKQVSDKPNEHRWDQWAAVWIYDDVFLLLVKAESLYRLQKLWPGHDLQNTNIKR